MNRSTVIQRAREAIKRGGKPSADDIITAYLGMSAVAELEAKRELIWRTAEISDEEYEAARAPLEAKYPNRVRYSKQRTLFEAERLEAYWLLRVKKTVDPIREMVKTNPFLVRKAAQEMRQWHRLATEVMGG